MKRIVLKTGCALMMLATCWGGAFVNAQNVDVSLNLRYTDPANPSGGGTWQLTAQQTGAGNGISGLVAIMESILDTNPEADVTIASGINALDPLNPGTPEERPPVISLTADITDLLYGQDSAESSTTIIYNVGRGAGTAGNVEFDSVANNASISSAWDNSALIASGSFEGARPTFTEHLGPNGTPGEENETAAAYWVNPSGHAEDQEALLASLTNVVRGDSVGVDGLLIGDANRNWTIDLDDFNAVINNFGSTNGWDQGNFSGTANGTVDLDDFNAVINGFGSTATPPGAGAGLGAGSAVPEPSSIALISLALLSLIGLKIRK